MKQNNILSISCLIVGLFFFMPQATALDLEGVIPSGTHESTDNIVVKQNSAIQEYSNVILSAYVDTIFKPNFTMKISATLTIKTIDDDGLSNQWEMDNFGHVDYGPTDDPDGDLLTNNWEFLMGFNPTIAANETEKNSDFDGDGYSNFIEALYDSDPTISDSKPALNSSIGVEYEYDAIGRIESIIRTN